MCDGLLGGHPKVRVAKCHIFYTEQIFQIKFYPIKSALIATNLTFQLNEIERDGYSKGKKVAKVSNKDKTTSKLVKFTPRILHFTKVHGVSHFLPQTSNIFTQIYLPYL